MKKIVNTSFEEQPGDRENKEITCHIDEMEVLTANELRIGNYVKYFDKYCKVEQIKHENSKYYIWAKPQQGTIYNVIDAFEPILLTPEILEKAGFFKQDYETWGIKIDLNAKIDFYTGWFMIWEQQGQYSTSMGDYRNDTNANFKYLHQLQNLYFAITNTELEINLD